MTTENPSGGCPYLGTAPVVDLDYLAPDYTENRTAITKTLLQKGVAYSPRHEGFYIASRHEHAYAVFMNNKTFINGRDQEDLPRTGNRIPSPPKGDVGDIPPEADGPVHRQYRRAMAPHLTSRAAKDSEERLRHWITVCIDEYVESGRIDFVLDVAFPVTHLFFSEILGIPLEEWPQWLYTTDQRQQYAFRDPENPPVFDDARLTERARELIRDRREHPRDDMITTLSQATGVDGELLSVPEAAAMIRTVLNGSVDAIRGLLSQTLDHLDSHPDDRRRLTEDPSLIPVANEEFLRHFMGNRLPRTVSETVEIDGHTLHRGDRVLIDWHAANHDPAVFDRPDEVDIDRNPKNHLTFGAGVHKCSGLHYARLMARVLLEEMLTRLTDFRLDRGSAVPVPSYGVAYAGYLTLPATFTPGPRRQSDRRPA